MNDSMNDPMNNQEMSTILHNLLGTEIVQLREVSGGDIGLSLYAETPDERFFVKYRLDLPGEVFLKEAEGLQALGRVGGLAVPNTHYAGEIPGRQGGMIVLEWIERCAAHSNTDDELGRGLAVIHQANVDDHRFGFYHDNYIGTLPQSNRWCESWLEFYREQRLAPMIETAYSKGRLDSIRLNKLMKLLDRLDRYIPDSSVPGLLHGDLWSGNWLAGPGGKPYLIDPAVFYGDHEYEMAFTELFGGFSTRFYAAYQEVYPLDRDYAERLPLYQLYFLLVHLIHFGELYGASVDRVLNRYV